MSGQPRPAHGGVTAQMRTSTELREPESDRDLPSPFQIQSYDDLLRFPEIPESTIETPSGKRAVTEPLVDAIVVPTIRSAEHLYSAVKLAAHARCHLVAIYTDRPPAGLSAVLDRFRFNRVTLLTVPSGSRDPWLDLGASLPQSRVSPAALDISRKRNLGLLIGRVCRWTRMLFLDDDICKLNVPKLSAAAAMLDDYPVVGLQVKKYPDASVVGHARRLTGRRQEPFVSGGSLLVDPQRLNGYFAPVYHEDWLCVINHLRKGKVAVGGSVGQLPYLPFATPERAQLEEFGDILLSGLLALVHKRGIDIANRFHHMTDSEYWREATEPHFWKQILEQRAVLLQDITTRLTEKSFESLSPLPSLRSATQRLGELRPGEFVSFTEEWLTSLAEWRGKLTTLARVDLPDQARAIEKALAKLGLAHLVRVHELSAQQVSARDNRRIGGFADSWGRWLGADGRRRFGMRGTP
jgi:hypothetical protein